MSSTFIIRMNKRMQTAPHRLSRVGSLIAAKKMMHLHSGESDGVVHIQLPRLPIEVLENIISFLPNPDLPRASRLALYNCALTCRVLLPASRYYLYKNILITSRKTLNCIARLLQCRSSLALFVEHAQELLVVEDERHPFAQSVPHVLGPHLPRIQAITLIGLDCTHNPLHPTFFLMCRQFRSVRALTLHHCHFRSLKQLCDLICSMSRLSELNLHSINWPAPGASSAITPEMKAGRPLVLSKLKIDLSYGDSNVRRFVDLCRWLVSTLSPSSVSELSLADPHTREPTQKYAEWCQATARLLHHVDQSLTTLSIKPSGDCLSSSDWADTPFQNSNISHLSIQFSNGITARELNSTIEILSRDGYSQLRQLTFCIEYGANARMGILSTLFEQDHSWEVIDQCLMRPQFKRLGKVETLLILRKGYEHMSAGFQESVLRLMKRRLPQVDARGYLVANVVWRDYHSAN